jgi:hypothetical protein
MSISMSAVKPYGYMAEPFERALKRCSQPRAWNNLHPYHLWVEAMVAKIATAIWPAWNPVSETWEGVAAGAALSLTAADLELMALLAGRYAQPARGAGGRETHEWWFLREDVLFGETPNDYPYGNTLENRFELCFPGCAVKYPELRQAFNAGGLSTYTASLSWKLKSRLQRPRAGHMAKLLGLQAPAVKMACSAWSPAAISGHAFQGLMGALQIHMTHHGTMSEDETKALRELAADIGDRRVLAGVHFPSDNLMSWWTALEVLPFLVKDKPEETQMRTFVVEAIRGSEVYQAMRASAGHHAVLGVLGRWSL